MINVLVGCCQVFGDLFRFTSALSMKHNPSRAHIVGQEGDISCEFCLSHHDRTIKRKMNATLSTPTTRIRYLPISIHILQHETHKMCTESGEYSLLFPVVLLPLRPGRWHRRRHKEDINAGRYALPVNMSLVVVLSTSFI